MANSLFQSLQKNQNGSLFDAFGGQQRFQQGFSQFVQNFRQQATCSPEQRVQQLLNSGQMTQEQFNQCRRLANQITGKTL